MGIDMETIIVIDMEIMVDKYVKETELDFY